MASAVSFVGLSLLLMAFVATGVAFFAPFWLVSLSDTHTEGLWGYCPPDQDCIWFFEDDFAWEKTHPGKKANQYNIFTFAAGLMRIWINLCCTLHSGDLPDSHLIQSSWLLMHYWRIPRFCDRPNEATFFQWILVQAVFSVSAASLIDCKI